MGFNTQPPEGGWQAVPPYIKNLKVSTHSRPKAAGFGYKIAMQYEKEFQHTAARRRLAFKQWAVVICRLFQHTAARRRLVLRLLHIRRRHCFNTQPPEGGWGIRSSRSFAVRVFQHTAARRRLAPRTKKMTDSEIVSTHSRPKAAGTRANLKPTN